MSQFDQYTFADLRPRRTLSEVVGLAAIATLAGVVCAALYVWF